MCVCVRACVRACVCVCVQHEACSCIGQGKRTCVFRIPLLLVLADNPEFRRRVSVALGLMVSAKLLNVSVPVLMKTAVDALAPLASVGEAGKCCTHRCHKGRSGGVGQEQKCRSATA